MEVEAKSRVDCNADLFNIDEEPTTHVDTTIAQTSPNDVESVNNPDKPSVVNGESHDVKPAISEAAKSAPATTAPQPPPVNKNHNVGKYRLLRTIGKGNFAKVKLAIHMATGVEVAIKIINKTVMDNTLLKRLKREITIMKMTNHPNIVKLLEIIENEDVLCLVMEYASGGEIFDYLVANGKMREKEARIKFRQLLSAIQYCHSKRIVHRDLKAENILLDQNLNVKVADFGLANTFEYGQRLSTFCGSPPYAAPELFLGISYHGPGVDVWSLGVILFTLVLGHLPFDARDLRELRNKILGLHYTIPKGSVSPECEGLLRKMLVLDPKDRSSLKALMQDKWVNFGYAPNEILRPYKEPLKSQLDEVRVKAMEAMGFTQADLESSVVHPEFDHVYATYHLLPETPSEFAHICEDMNQTTQTFHGPVSLPQSLVNEQQTGTSDTKPVAVEQSAATAIGRFTVAPSIKSPEQNELQPRASHLSNASAKHSLMSSETREHHSLTSALPVAFKRAFLQMGRTLAGGATMSSSPPDARTPVQPVRPTKSTSKHSDGRSVITAAPVPMGSLKKHSANSGQPQKRPSPVHPTVTPVASSKRSDSSDSSSSATTTTRHTTGTPTKADAQIQRPNQSQSYTGHPKTLSDRTKDSTVASVQSQSSKDTVDSATRARTTPTPASVKGSPPATDPAPQLMNAHDSTDQRRDAALEESAKRLVLAVWNDVVTREESSINESSLPKDIPSHEEHVAIDIPRPDIEVHSIKSEPLKTPETKADIRRSLTNVSEQTSTDLEPWASAKKANKMQPQIKVSHTVQGTAAHALRNEALRIQSSGISTPEPQTPNTYTMDTSHQNTWSRGVLRALGGLFVQSKSPDVRSDPSRASNSLAKPREVRFPWSVHTTSTKSADEVLSSIVVALEATPGCRYSHDPHLPYLLQCSWAADREALRPSTTPTDPNETPRQIGLIRGDPVHWEMEVCQLPRLHLRGVRLKRIRGTAQQFRSIADLVMKSLHL